MSRKGGYKIIDFKGIELTDATKIDGIMNDIINSKEKVLLISGVYLNGVKQEDEFATFTINKNTIYIKTSYGNIEIAQDIVDYITPNKLKLVATGTKINDANVLNFDNQLEHNKLYYLQYYSEEMDEFYNAISSTLDHPIMMGSNQDGEPAIFTVSLTIATFSLSSFLEESLITSSDYIKVYELPFTI